MKTVKQRLIAEIDSYLITIFIINNIAINVLVMENNLNGKNSQ